MQKLSDRFQLGLLCFIILIIGGIVFYFSFWVIDKLRRWSLLILSAVVGLYVLADLLNKMKKGKVMTMVFNIISAPVFLLSLLGRLVQPFVAVAGAFLFVMLFSFVLPAIVFIFLSSAFGWELARETIAFISIVVGSILCTNTYRFSKWIIHSSPIGGDSGSHDSGEYRERLAFYVIHPKNLVFVLYFLFFVFLAITGYLQIQTGRCLTTPEFDAAVMKAFLVFIAFTNMRSKANDMELDSKELLKQTLTLLFHDVK